MYPRGSNGAAQGTIDARTLADCLAVCHAGRRDLRDALRDYESRRLGPASDVVRTNRAHPPDFINIKVEELVGDRPFDDLDKYITQPELRALSENYKRVAGFALGDVTAA
jgi:5-methylphenazine-1-carboxylate 1-monooxygenase